MCNMLTDVLARAILLCIAVFWNKHANDCVMYLHCNNSQGIGSDCPFAVKKSKGDAALVGKMECGVHPDDTCLVMRTIVCSIQLHFSILTGGYGPYNCIITCMWRTLLYLRIYICVVATYSYIYCKTR